MMKEEFMNMKKLYHYTKYDIIIPEENCKIDI